MIESSTYYWVNFTWTMEPDVVVDLFWVAKVIHLKNTLIARFTQNAAKTPTPVLLSITLFLFQDAHPRVTRLFDTSSMAQRRFNRSGDTVAP
jgi:hypothetical protein